MADGRQRKLVVGRIRGECGRGGRHRGARGFGAVNGDGAAETKLGGHVRNLARAEFHAKLGERGIGRPCDGLLQGDLPVYAIGLCLGVRQLCGGSRQGIAGARRNLRVRLIIAGFQRSRGDDGLERGPWWVQLRGGAVDQWAILARRKFVVGLRRGFGVMGRQFVRIITGRAHHGEDTTGADFDGHRRPIAPTELIVGNLLQLGVDGGFDGRALIRSAGEHGLGPLPDQ